jgi:hypothetical protein
MKQSKTHLTSLLRADEVSAAIYAFHYTSSLFNYCETQSVVIIQKMPVPPSLRAIENGAAIYIK